MMEIIINGKALTEDEVKLVVNEWYTNGMYSNLLHDEFGLDLEEILDVGSIKEPFEIETIKRGEKKIPTTANIIVLKPWE